MDKFYKFYNNKRSVISIRPMVQIWASRWTIVNSVYRRERFFDRWQITVQDFLESQGFLSIANQRINSDTSVSSFRKTRLHGVRLQKSTATGSWLFWRRQLEFSQNTVNSTGIWKISPVRHIWAAISILVTVWEHSWELRASKLSIHKGESYLIFTRIEG